MPEIRSMGTTLHYGATGEGTPIVALHGSASTGAQWRSLAGYLGGRHLVVTPDLAGYGRSGLPRGVTSLAGEAAFLAPLIDALGEPVHLVGHSYGGAVALELARTSPEAVRSLTVIEPAAFHLLAATAEGGLLDEIVGVVDTVVSRAASGERESATTAFIDYWNGRGAWARSSRELRAFFAGCLDRIIANFDCIAATRAAAGLAGIAVPVLAVMGLESPLPSMRITELVAEMIPGARLALVAGAGHMAPLTDPHLVDPLVAEHIAAARESRPVRAAA